MKKKNFFGWFPRRSRGAISGGIGTVVWLVVFPPGSFGSEPLVRSRQYAYPPGDDGGGNVYPAGYVLGGDNNSAAPELFYKNSWSAGSAVPNSEMVRAGDPTIPANFVLESVTFKYSAHIVNWIAVENENVSGQTFTFSLSSTLSLIRDFNGDQSQPAPHPGGAVIASLSNSSGTIDRILEGDDNRMGKPRPGDGFPFLSGPVETFEGRDAFVASANSTAFVGGTNSPAPSYERSFSSSTILTSGAEFATWRGTNAGTVPVTFVCGGNLDFASVGNFVVGARAFSNGSLEVTYVFVPEAGFGGPAAVAFMTTLGGWWVVRRKFGIVTTLAGWGNRTGLTGRGPRTLSPACVDPRAGASQRR